MPPSPSHPQVSTALAHARAGQATLPELASACELAARGGPSRELGELREHLRRMVPAPVWRGEAKSIVIGIVSGVLTHYLLRSLQQKE